jgi:hypothetical protein
MNEPVAYLRDLDGTGSFHVCAKGDPGCFPVFAIAAATRRASPMLKSPTDLRNHVFSALSTGIIERDPFNRVRIIHEISKATSRESRAAEEAARHNSND